MSNRRYDAIDVANYIVNYCIDIGKPVSNLKLQKLLYYVQVASWYENDKPMFEDEICAWTYGPVVKRVYHEFKSYVNAVIDDYITEKFDVFGMNYDNNYDPSEIIEDNDCELINKIVNAYKSYTPLAMVRKTHNEAPWIEAYSNNIEVISNKSIKQYYQLNRNLIYGTE